MAWQGIARHRAQSYMKTVVHCEAGYQFLYKDFADEIHQHAFFPEFRNMWAYKPLTFHEFNGNDVLIPSKEVCLNGYQQSFVRLGIHSDVKITVLMHARSTNNGGWGYRNWPLYKWEELFNKLDSFGYAGASVGTHDGAEYIPGTIDLRGEPLASLANIMRAAKVFVSPSSGPAHFASLCGLRHVVWSDIKMEAIGCSNKDRYEHKWNPFKTPCAFLPTWQPSVDDVFGEVRKCLSRL